MGRINSIEKFECKNIKIKIQLAVTIELKGEKK